jgi:hypothetical protein
LSNLIPESARKLESPEAKEALASLEGILAMAREALGKLGSFLPKEEASKEGAEEKGDHKEETGEASVPPGKSQDSMDLEEDPFDLEALVSETGLDEEAAGQARANPPKKARTSPYCR